MPITEQDAIEAQTLAEQFPDRLDVLEASAKLLQSYKAQQEEASQPLFPEMRRREVDDFAKVRGFFTEKETHGLDEQTRQSLYSDLPEEEDRAAMFSEELLARYYGRPAKEIRALGTQYRDQYAIEKWGAPVKTYKEFFDKQANAYAIEDEVDTRAQDAGMRGLPRVMGWADPKAFGKDPDAALDQKAMENQKELQARFEETHAATKTRLAPYRQFVQQTVEDMKTTMGKAGAQGETASFREFAERLSKIPKSDLNFVISAIRANAGGTEEGKAVLQKIAENLGRGIDDIVGGIDTMGDRVQALGIRKQIEEGVEVPAGKELDPETYLQAVKMKVFAGDAYDLRAGVLKTVAGKEFAKPSEETKSQALALANTLLDTIDLHAEVKSIAEKDIDPAQGEHMYSRGLYALVRSLPYTAVAMARGGTVINGLAMQEQAYQALGQVNPDMSREQKIAFSAVAAPLMALTEKIPVKILSGRLPTLGRLMNQATATSGAFLARGSIRLGGGIVANVVQENVQDLMPFAVQSAVSALSQDVSEVPWEKVYGGKFWEQQGEIFFATLPLVLVGTGVGTIRDFKSARETLHNRDAITLLVGDREKADEIRKAADAGDYDTAQTLLRKGMKEAKTDSVPFVQARAAAGAVLRAHAQSQADAIKKAEQAGYIPEVLPREGGFVFRMKEGESPVFPTREDANAKRWEHVEEQGLELQEEVIDLIDFLSRAPSPDRKVNIEMTGKGRTMLDAVNEGQVTRERALGRSDAAVQIDDQQAPQDTAPEQGTDFDIDSEYSEAFNETERKALDDDDRLAGMIILGETSTEFRDQVYETDVKLNQGYTWATVIEEKTEGDAAAFILKGKRDWLATKLFGFDAEFQKGRTVGGKKLSIFKDGVTMETATDEDLKEAYSRAAIYYFTGRMKKGDGEGFQATPAFRSRYARAIRAGLAPIFDPLARFFRAVAVRAARLNKMRRERRLDPELERELARSVGITEQFEYEQKVTKQKEKILEEIDPDGVLFPIAEANEAGYQYGDERTATNRDSELPIEISGRETGSSFSIIAGRVSQPTGDGRGRDSSGGNQERASSPLDGAPRKQGATGPDLRIVDVARSYARSIGLPFGRQKIYATVNPERGERIAQAYDEMVHAPRDPVVAEAYANLIEQTTAQYRALEQAGFKFWFYDKTNDPYDGNPYNAMREIRARQSMGVFATEAGFGSSETASDTSENAMMVDTGIQWPYGSPDGPLKRVLANDLFRAVHDAFGHGLEGSGFRGRGEENAWQAHIRLYTGSAVGAITSETRGQNSWLNFGPYGEHNQTASVEKTIFAEQKTGLMPEWTWTEGRVEHDVETTFSVIQSDTGRSVVVGARPGEFGWTPGGIAATEKEKQNLESELASLSDDPEVNAERIREIEEELRGIASKTLPGPVTHPTQKRPRLERVGEAAGKILKSGKAKKLLSDLYGVTGLNVKPIAGTWLGNREPSYVIQGESLTDEQAAEVGALFGFAWAQDATVVSRPNPSLTEGIPAYYLGSRKRLSETQINAIHEASRERGLDFSSTPDGKAVQFLFFGEEADLPAFTQSIADIKQASGLTESHQELVSSDLNETQTNFSPSDGSGRTKAWLHGTAEGLALFERVVSDLVAPYAKAIGAEGYRFNVDLYAKRFGLSAAQTEIVRKALYPSHGKLKSSVPIMDGSIDLGVEGVTKKNGRFVSSVTNVVWSLQNWSAQFGLIAPGDYSKQAGKLIAQTIADEVAWHVQKAKESGKRSAIGWYDRALKAAKRIYARMFSELDVNGAGYNADMAMVFDAMLGIASQGNNVTDNSVMNTRVYANWRRDKIDAAGNINVTQGMTITQAVAPVTGTFGSKTVAIENNYLKLETLLANNSYADLRKFFNKTDTVGNINAYLRKNKNLWFNGEPLSVDGAAAQKVTGWMVFGPKIGSFINNLHGDYTTLTADLWFSRTWNRILGWSFIHSPEREAQNFISLRDAMVAEYTNDQSVRKIEKGKPVYWDHGTDVAKLGLTPEEFDDFINDPQKMLDFASRIEVIFRTGAREGAKKTTSYKDKSAVRRAAKTWVENREDVMEAPRSDHERMFQQDVMENAQKMLKKMGIDINIADMQAALWYNEKDLYATLGSTTKLSAPADYEDAAKTTFRRIQEGTLYERIGSKEGEVDERIQPREWEAAIFAGINLKSEDGDRTFSVISADIPINRMRRLMQQIDAMYSTGRTEGVENLEAELETLLEKADSDLDGMDEGDDADQVGEMLSSNIAEVDSANPSPEEELINQWYRWTGKGVADDSESLRETYPTFGAFVRAGTGDNAYVVQPGVTDEQIEEAAKESAENYERRRAAMLRSRVEKVTFSVLNNAESRIADSFNPYFRSPKRRREILLEAQSRGRETARDFQKMISLGKNVGRLNREQATREGVIYGDLLVQYFGADTDAKVAALPAVDTMAARSEAKRQAAEWRKAQDRQQKKIPRDTLIAAMRTLDAMISALPIELRGRVGGMVKLAQFTTPEAMLGELERRAEKMDDVLETYLKKEADKEVKKLFEIAKPAKDESGKAKKGKAGADIHDLFDMARKAWKSMSAVDAEAHAVGLESKVAAGNLTPEEEAHALLEAELVRAFGGWNDVYQDSGKVDKNGKRIMVKTLDGADAVRKNHALDTATYIWKAGYLAYQQKKAAEKARRDVIRQDLEQNTGKTGLRSERALAEEAGVTLPGKAKDFFLSLLNFEQLVTWIFGKDSQWAQWFADQQRKAENTKLDAVQAVVEGVEDLFTSLAGGDRFKGEQLQFRMMQRSLKATAANGDVVPLSELEALSALLMWQQEDGKRHLRGTRDANGKLTSRWSYDQKFIDEISGKLSQEAWSVLGYLQAEYGKEYAPLNAVYREVYGINLPKNPNYSPLLVKPQQASPGQMQNPVTGTTASSGSFTPPGLRTRAIGVSAEPDFRDAVATFIGHKKQMEHWKANAKFVLEANAVLGNRDLGNAIEAAHGEQAVMILRKWLDAIAQGGVRDASAGTWATKLFERITGRAASMALVGRIGTLAIQATQLGAASALMPTGAYVVRLGKLLSGNLGWSNALASPYIQRRLKQQPVMVQAAMEGLRAGSPTQLKHQVRKIGSLLNGADALFTAGTYAMVYDFHLKQALDGGMSETDAQAYAAGTAERAVESVAQPTRMGTRSYFEVSSSNPFMRLSWAFASDARKNAALLGYAYTKGDATDKLRTTLFVIGLNGLISGIIRSAWRDLRDDEDEEIFDDKYWSAKRLALSTSTDWLFGFPVIGEEIQRALYAAAGEYQPDGGLLSAGKDAIGPLKRTRENLGLILEGDWEQPLRDTERVMTAMGLFSDSAAAATSVMHLVRDLYGLGTNFIPD